MYDLIILGAGPAGLTASIYASRYGIDHVLIGAETGGYLNEIHKVENYPGLPSIAGFDLAQKMKEHVESFGDYIRQGTIRNITRTEKGFELETEKKKTYLAKHLIYSIGTTCRKLNILGEDDFLGKGVSYCATCDGPFFKKKDVIVIGGGNSAAMAALMLSGYAKTVTIVYRRELLRCDPAYADKIEEAGNITVLYNTVVEEINGKMAVQSVILKTKGKKSTFKTDGVFIEIGSDPNREIISKLNVMTDKFGYVITKPDQSTNVPGFYAAGDITTNSNGFRQIITAASEGAIAALSVFENIKGAVAKSATAKISTKGK
ncbi:MAG: FAD-dependent oxidoreductase [Patescibacteria group bacterium]|nr:FAD-dependent oxidoreductase [Patescibacteria group bacterium]